jgi:hypothetical protein
MEMSARVSGSIATHGDYNPTYDRAIVATRNVREEG